LNTTFTKDEMIDILDEGKDVISNEIVDKTRWSIHHEIIFRKNDKLYRAHYSVGATESQDESPWEYEKRVDCTEVEAYEKTITAYRDVA
jgi:hypothetical protein